MLKRKALPLSMAVWICCGVAAVAGATNAAKIDKKIVYLPSRWNLNQLCIRSSNSVDFISFD